MTLDLLSKRHSVRSYSTRPLSDSDKARIRSAVTAVNSHEAGLHFVLVTDSPEAFDGLGRSYGVFRGVRNYIALIVDSSSYKFMPEKAGYYAQMLVMKCVSMGLATCFVGATFSRRHLNVQLRAGWEILAVVTLGYPEDNSQTEGLIARVTHKLLKRKSKGPLQFYAGDLPWGEVENIFPGMLDALKAVALAPSAMNRQPVSIYVREKDGVDTVEENDGTGRYDTQFKQVEAETRRFLLSPVSSVMQPELDFDGDYIIEASVPKKSQLIDLGIAMWNFEQIFPGYWEWGNPARFIPATET